MTTTHLEYVILDGVRSPVIVGDNLSPYRDVQVADDECVVIIKRDVARRLYWKDIRADPKTAIDIAGQLADQDCYEVDHEGSFQEDQLA